MVPGPEVQTLGWGQYGHLVKMYWILKNLLCSFTFLRKTKCNDSDVHNAFHVSCEIHGPWDKGSGIREGPKWTDSSSINILNLRKSSPIPYKFEKN